MLDYKRIISAKYKNYLVQIDEKYVYILGKLGNLCYKLQKTPKNRCKKPQKKRKKPPLQ